VGLNGLSSSSVNPVSLCSLAAHAVARGEGTVRILGDAEAAAWDRSALPGDDTVIYTKSPEPDLKLPKIEIYPPHGRSRWRLADGFHVWSTRAVEKLYKVGGTRVVRISHIAAFLMRRV